MAIINAAANGLWSSSATWPGSVFPTSADDVFANNRTIYIDQDINVLSLNTTAGAGGVAGGRFYANQGDLTINSSSINAGTTYCVTVTGTGTRTLSTQFIRASNTTASTAGVLVLGTTGLPNVITYGNAIGGLVGGGSATTHPAGITIEGGSLTHYGFISGGNVANRSSGLKIYQGGGSTIPVSATIYGNIKGGPEAICAGAICEFSPNVSILSSCQISVYGNLSGGNSLRNAVTENAGVYLATTIPTFIYGDIYGGSGYSITTAGLRVVGAQIVDVNIIGNIYNSPEFAGCNGLAYTSTLGNINITGNAICLDTYIGAIATNQFGAASIYQNGGTTLNVLGDVYGCVGTKNFGGVGIYLDATNTTNVTGNVYGGTTGNAFGIYCNDSPNTVNIYGNVYGSSVKGSINGIGIYNNTTARVNIFGASVAGEGIGSHGTWNQATGTIYVKRAVANSFGLGSASEAYNIGYGVVGINISGINLVEEMVFGRRGQIPVYGPTYIVNTATNSVTGRTTSLLDPITNLQPTILVDASATETFLPATSDVVSTTIYNNNSLTGTMIVPLPSAVSYRVPVSNTTGTAFITPGDFWNTQTTQLTGLSTTIGFRLNGTATTEYIGNTLAAYNI